MATHVTEIAREVEERVKILRHERAELDKQILKLQVAAQALNGDERVMSTNEVRALNQLPPISEVRAQIRRGEIRKAKAKRGRPKGSGSRIQMILDFLRDNPNSTIPEIAKGTGMAQANYLYRAVPQLERQGKVKRNDEKPPRWSLVESE